MFENVEPWAEPSAAFGVKHNLMALNLRQKKSHGSDRLQCDRRRTTAMSINALYSVWRFVEQKIGIVLINKRS